MFVKPLKCIKWKIFEINLFTQDLHSYYGIMKLINGKGRVKDKILHIELWVLHC
jgi:hypothetical protein